MHSMFDMILARVSKYIIGCKFTYRDVLLLTFISNNIFHSHTSFSFLQLTIKNNILSMQLKNTIHPNLIPRDNDTFSFVMKGNSTSNSTILLMVINPRHV